MAKKENKLHGSVRLRNGKWYYSFEAASIGGTRRRIERVAKSASSEKEAIIILNKAIKEYENAGEIIDTSSMSFSDYLDMWFEKYVTRNCKDKTQYAYSSMIKVHIKPALGKFKIDTIRYMQLQDFIDLKAETLGKSSINTIITILKLSFKHAKVKYRLIKENPALEVSKPKIIKAELDKEELDLVISVDQFNQIISMYKKDAPIAKLMKVALRIGTRFGETRAISWQDIDFEKNIISINKTMYKHAFHDYKVGSPKTKKSVRKIRFSDEFKKFLLRVRTEQNLKKIEYGEHYVKYSLVDKYIVPYDPSGTLPVYDLAFTNNDGSIIGDGVCQNVTTKVSKELGFYFKFHMLRHTHASLLNSKKVNPALIQRVMGHSQMDTTALYLHEVGNEEIEMVGTIDEFLHDVAM